MNVATSRNDQFGINFNSMFELERVYTTAPENADSVVAIKLCIAREKRILFCENFSRHQRSNGIRCHESTPVFGTDLGIALRATTIADDIPRRESHLVLVIFSIGTRTEAFDKHAEVVIRRILAIVSPTIQNDQAQIVFILIARLYFLNIDGVRITDYLSAALIVLAPRVVKASRSLQRNLQIANILIRTINRINDNIIT